MDLGARWSCLGSSPRSSAARLALAPACAAHASSILDAHGALEARPTRRLVGKQPQAGLGPVPG